MSGKPLEKIKGKKTMSASGLALTIVSLLTVVLVAVTIGTAITQVQVVV